MISHFLTPFQGEITGTAISQIFLKQVSNAIIVAVVRF